MLSQPESLRPDVCDICGARLEQKVVNLPFFRHIDFATISESATVQECKHCYTVRTPDLFLSQKPVFETQEYALSLDSRRKRNPSAEQQKWVAAQALFIAQCMKRERLCILDIGCSDGELLFELGRLFPNSTLVGYDLFSHERSEDILRRVDHFTERESEVWEFKFDLVIYSHSIAYIPNIRSHLAKVKQVLLPEGQLYIQGPDVNKNPLYSLMGDQAYLYTPCSLASMLRLNGFGPDFRLTQEFPRELICTASLNGDLEAVNACPESGYTSALRSAASLSTLLCQYETEKSSSVGVLGTTINGAFADEILGDRLAFFVDENWRKSGTNIFRGKRVIHPSKLERKCEVLVPYGPYSIGIASRLAEKYQQHFSPVSG